MSTDHVTETQKNLGKENNKDFLEGDGQITFEF